MNPQGPQGPYQQPNQGPMQQMPQNPNLPPPGFNPGANMSAAPAPQFSAMETKRRKPWVLIILLVIFVLSTFGASGFGFWAYAEMTDYKTNTQAKIDVAVAAAVKEAEDTKEREFLERNKSPYKGYKTPATFGAVEITYPRTWAATVDEKGTGGTPVVGYFHPDYVPGPSSGTAFALKLEVMERPYDQVLKSYDANAKNGKVKVSPYTAPRVRSVLGSRVDGEIQKDFRGTAILLPLRDKTIRITTLSGDTFGKDLNDIILKNLIFTP